jgi:hypothetical protein
LLEPRQALDKARPQTQVVSLDGKVKAGITQTGATKGPSTCRLNSVDTVKVWRAAVAAVLTQFA